MKYTAFFNWLVLQFYQSIIMLGFCRSGHIVCTTCSLGHTPVLDCHLNPVIACDGSMQNCFAAFGTASLGVCILSLDINIFIFQKCLFKPLLYV